MNNKIVVVLVVVLLAVSLTEARRRKNKANRNPDRCIYKRDKSAGKPECIKGSMTFTMKLKSGAANCTETMTKVKNCRNKDCKYKVVSMECNQVTNKMVKTMQLKEGGDETKCEKTITVEKRRCKNNADKAAKKAARKEKNKARKAARKAARKSAKGARRARKHNKGMKEGTHRCRYTPGPWEACDQTSDTMTKTLTLTSGDPTHCTKTKIMRKSCRKSCQYKPGKWGQCNPSTGLVERQDRLKPNSAKFCAQYRMLTKKCKKIKKRNSCKYKIGQWGPCDPASKKRTKVLTLIKGNANKCKPVKEIQRLCIRPDGSDRCFFGQWKAWEGCQNGVRKRQREVLQGGEDCQIRAVRVQPC